MSQQWIHVVTASKLPVPRGGQSSPFEIYAVGFDPNEGTPFGPTHETMFLEVQDIPRPEVNEVLEQVAPVQTAGIDGRSYHGEYVDPYWNKSWSISPQDLATSKELKTELLAEGRDVAVAAGYAIGSFQFPLTEHFFRLLADRLKWLEEATAALAVPPNTKLTFSDLLDREVSVGLDTLRARFISFGKEYLGMYEKVVAATDEIKEATTPAEVDAVTWSF